MKILKSLFTLVGVAVLSSLFANLQAQEINRYAVKSATIVYKHTGMTEGKQTVYIADYGQKEADYSELTASAFGFSTTTKELELTLGNVVYSVDLTEKTGTKTILPDIKDLDKKEVKDYEQLGKEMMESMGFEKVGTEKVLGKSCEVWEGMGTKSWIWKNIPLKTEMNMMGKSTIIATSIDLSNPPASKFKVPQGIDFETIEGDRQEASEEDMENLQESLEQLKGLLGTKKKK